MEIGDIGDFEVVPGTGQVGDMGFQAAQNRFMQREDEGTTEPPPEGDTGDEDTESAGGEEADDGKPTGEGGEEEGGEPEGEGGDEDEGQPAEPSTLSDEYLDSVVTLKDGSQVSVREAIQGYYRQDHFTRVMQGVREKEREFESNLSKLEEWSERNADLNKLGNTLKANPWLAEALQHLWTGDFEAASEVAQRGQRVVPQAPAQPQQPDRDDTAMRLFLEERWARELGEIKSQHPDVDEKLLWDALQFHADERGMPSMWATFRAVYFDRVRETAKKQGRNQAVRQMKKGANQPTSMKPGSASSPGKAKYEGSTAAERALKQFRDSG